MNIVGMPFLTPSLYLLGLIFRYKRDLPKPRPLRIHFPYTKPSTGIFTKIKNNFFRIDRKGDFTDKSIAPRHIRYRNNRPLFLRIEVIYIDAVFRYEAILAGSVIDVCIIMIRGIRFSFYENNFLETKFARTYTRRSRGIAGIKHRKQKNHKNCKKFPQHGLYNIITMFVCHALYEK